MQDSRCSICLLV